MSSKFVEQMTLTEVAAELGISRQRVKQIETVALDKLRNNPKVRGLYEGIKGDTHGDPNSASISGIRDSWAR